MFVPIFELELFFFFWTEFYFVAQGGLRATLVSWKLRLQMYWKINKRWKGYYLCLRAIDISCQEEITELLFGSSNPGLTLENVGKEVFLSRGLSSRPLEEYSHQDRLSALVLVANRFPKLGSVVQGLSLGLWEGLFQSLKAKCLGKAFFFKKKNTALKLLGTSSL